ncbi:hypothetical protein NW762_009645 [Fusarium torreyae]|uniref:Uncharacterized protein n=1 Tax=Fusarium torreyae TaxID=1237075 RepID=A0A9W8RUR3_9HYPO|nr:hypothetical protein NW762_009645 [Fusarium torreyae]
MAERFGGSSSRERNTLGHPMDLESYKRGLYVTKNEDGYFPCSQVAPNSILLAWQRLEGDLPKDKVPAFLVGPSFQSQEDFRFLGEEYAPGAEPSKFKPTNLNHLVIQSRSTLGTWWKFMNLEGRTYWQPSDPWDRLDERSNAALRLLGLEGSTPGAEECAVNTSAQFRACINERNWRSIREAKKNGKALENMVWDDNGMVWKWDGMINEVLRAVKAGALPELDDIGVVGDDESTEKTMIRTEDPSQHDWNIVEDGEIEALPVEQASRYLELINNLDVRAVDWEPIVDYLKAEQPLKADVVYFA